MRIDGEWFRGEDGVERPVVHAEIRTTEGQWHPAPLIVDRPGNVVCLLSQKHSYRIERA